MKQHTASPHQDIQKEVKGYLTIFLGLLVLSAVTIMIHMMHLPIHLSIALILGIAFVQAALSACYFMHLISEQKIIYLVLILTFIFFLGMITLFYCGYYAQPQGSKYVS